MLSHAELRAIWMQAWRAFAWIDGEPVEIVGGLPSRTYSSRRVRGTCSFGVPELPQPGKFAQVDLVLNGLETARFFTGKTAEQTAQLASFTRTANLVDRLDLDRAVATELTWSSTPFVDAVRALLNQADIADEEIASIYDPGATYVLGADYPIVIATTENIGRVFGELMEFGGTAAYVSPTGRIKVVEASGIPAATSPVIYAYGADADTEFGITDSGLRIGSSESVVNTFTATGPKRPDGAAPDGTYQSGLTGRPASQSYRFAQSDETCQAIAARELSRRARDIREYWFEAPLNPLLLPGDSILYRDPTVGLNANTPAYIWEVSTTADAKMRVQISIGPSLVDGYSSSVAPPDADFAMTVEHQPVTLEGVPVVLYLVQVADQSRDPSGEIVSRAWTATGPGATPASASDVERAIFTFTSLDGAEISLTVTSSTDEAATVTRSPASNQIQILSRVVSVAADEGWFVLTGPAGWNSFTSGGACTAVPPYNEQGPLIAGFSDGDIYRSADNLMTAPTTLATLDGSVGCLWVNETNISHILAGHGSKLSRSLNGGATWTLVSTFPATVNYCQSSPNNTNELRVCAGDREYISWDGGVTWPASVVGAAGSTAQDVGQAPWGHAVAFSGSIAAADAVKFEEGYAVDWTGVAAESLPASGLQAITPLLDEQGFLATAGYSLVRDGSLASLVLSADSGGESIYKLLLNPVTTAFDATLLTPATAVGPGKLLNQAQSYPIGDSSATQIGLGRLGAAIMAPQNIPSSTTNARGLNLGTSGTAPTGWEWPAFNDSGWDAAILYSGPMSMEGADPICATGSTPNYAYHLTRQAVTMPAGRIVRARLVAKADDQAQFYVNGVLVGAITVSNFTISYTFDVDISLLSGPVVIAARIYNDFFAFPPNPMGVAYVLELNYE